MHDVRPSTYIHEALLHNPSTCPECKKQFVTKDGIIFNVPYVQMQTQERLWGLMCFCSWDCVINWYPRQLMGQG